MNKEERYGILYKDEKGYRHFNNIKCSTRLNYKGDDIIPLWEFAESLQSQLDIANNKLKKVKEYFKEELEKLNNYYAQDEVNEALQKEFKKLQSIIGSD